MYNTIKDIWYGNLQPSTDYTVNGQEIMALHKKHEEAEKAIASALNEESRKLFEGLIESYFDLIDLLQADSFVKGFKLGSRLMKEILE